MQAGEIIENAKGQAWIPSRHWQWKFAFSLSCVCNITSK